MCIYYKNFQVINPFSLFITLASLESQSFLFG